MLTLPSVREHTIQAQSSLIKIALFQRWHVRVLILLIAFVSAVAGLLSPFFQKVFVDRLMGGVIFTHGQSGFGWLESSQPLLFVMLAFFCTMTAQGLSLLANYVAVCEGVILQRYYSEKLYEKTLGLRSDRMSGTTVGEVVSLYATDVAGSSALIDQSIPMASSIVFPLVFAPIAIQWICGIPITATLVVMGLMISLNIALATRQSRFFYRFKMLAAERTGLVNEWVQNIRLLRILGWVENFETKIFAKREEETVNRVSMVTNGQLMNSFGSSITYVINLTGVAALVFLRDKPVTAGELFALLWIFGVFLTRPFRQFPWLFTMTLDSITSIRRLEAFMARPSDPASESAASDVGTEHEAAMGIEVRGLTLELAGKNRLDDVSFEVKAGEFVAIIGEVGSGKSLLVLSLMGETGAKFASFRLGSTDAISMDLNERRRHFAFVPQEGFVMSATLRENVAFLYEAPRSADADVERSLAVSQFRLETEQVRDGLETEIGERGVNLSGGQRQRVSLARAHFFDRPIVLLDDCLSAVDVDTEKQLIRDLISGAWKDKTRLLITHRLSVLALVDRILFMEDGRVIDSGTFDELMARSEKMREYVASVRRSEAAQEGSPVAEPVVPVAVDEKGGGDVEAESVS